MAPVLVNMFLVVIVRWLELEVEKKGKIPGEARVFLRVPGQSNQADGDLLFDRTFDHPMDPLSTRHVHLQRH